MLQTVDVGQRSLESYRGVAPDGLLDEGFRLGRELRGIRVLHLNATPYGGGVAELLRSLVPLLSDLGLVADWKIISGDDDFFQVTKTIHNGLQGRRAGLSETARATYRANAERNAAFLQERYDVVFVHDPQPAAILPLRGKDDARWVWRCHIDTSDPDPEVWSFVREYLADYDAAVFTMAEFAPPGLPIERREFVPPAIDPLSPKNMPLDDLTARRVLEWIGIRLDRGLVTQVSRFDPWKDPLGVITAYRLARRKLPGLQLALVGSMATDDPEGWQIYRDVLSAAAGDPLVHVFTNLSGVGNIEVNAFQRLSSAIVQKSIREGFGLVVSEALWKGTPVVAGRTGGIPLQMADGIGGLLVDSVEECAEAIVTLLRDRESSLQLARRGQERVREHFLLPRLLLDDLELIAGLVAARPVVRPPGWEARHDPVCGMAIPADPPPVSEIWNEQTYVFCSEACRARFASAPERYTARPQRPPGE
ncbi:MAG: glycosyltransferase [Thermodesulfobacteriota bacterium]